MSEQRPSDVLGSLPRRRPHRRSAKRGAPPETSNGTQTTARTAGAPAKATPVRRAAKPAAAKPAAIKPTPPAAEPTPTPAPATARRRPQPLRQPAQPAGVPPTSHGRPAADEPASRHLLGTAAQAAAELAEIGLSVSARALRRVVDRLPRP